MTCKALGATELAPTSGARISPYVPTHRTEGSSRIFRRQCGQTKIRRNSIITMCVRACGGIVVGVYVGVRFLVISGFTFCFGVWINHVKTAILKLKPATSIYIVIIITTTIIIVIIITITIISASVFCVVFVGSIDRRFWGTRTQIPWRCWSWCWCVCVALFRYDSFKWPYLTRSSRIRNSW